MTTQQTPLIFAHIGDTHITESSQQNYVDLLAIVAQLASLSPSQLDFVLLPGDNADNGRKEQYAMISTALKMLEVPVYFITGDHDMQQGDLTNFYTMPRSRKLPFAEAIRGCFCIFLDVCGPGSGGPDFRLGSTQLEWLQGQLRAATQRGKPALLFMHTYPADLRDDVEKTTLLKLISEYNVILVDMGHTHYNEIANDGKTIYTATRSTGQIEEGAAGYSITSIDQGIVGWRFKLLAEPFPFVVITNPGDYRLSTTANKAATPSRELRTVVLNPYPVDAVVFSTGDNNWTSMNFDAVSRCYTATLPSTTTNPTSITVKAIDRRGRPGIHTIICKGASITAKTFSQTGSDESSIGAWPENGIYGTQLGPNRNAKPQPKK